VLTAVYRGSIVLVLLFAYFTHNVRASIGPTNTATVSGSVSDSTGKPVANADVALRGTKSATTRTDARGFFVFIGMPFGAYQISAAAVGLGTATRALTVDGDMNIAIQYEPASQNGLKVIAQVSSMANARFNVTPASVTQVSPRANAFDGKTSWRAILEQIPGISEAGAQGGTNVMAVLPDGPLVPMQISIDGSLPYETATLLDDMPLIGNGASATSALQPGKGTNLADYPLNGFDSADVVRGPGANAPSIVDSIGGSFVLHGPSVVNQNSYDLSLSTDPYGGIVANAFAAVRWKKLSMEFTYGVNDSPGPFSHNGVVASGPFGSLPSTINGLAFSGTSPSLIYAPGYSATSNTYYGYTTSLLTASALMPGTAWSEHGGSAALNYAFSPSLSIGIFYAGQSMDMASEPLANYTNTFVPPAAYTGSIPAGQSIDPSTSFLSPLSTPRASSLVEEKITAQLGRGVLRLAALQNRIFSSYGFSSPATATVQLFGGGCIASSPGGTSGCAPGYAPIVFNGANATVTYPFTFSYKNFDGSDNRDTLLSYATPLGENMHAGASFVTSYYNIPTQIFEKFSFSPNPTILNCGLTEDSETTNEVRVFIGGSPTPKTSLDLSMYFVNAHYHVPNPVGYSSATGTSPNGWLDPQYSYSAPRLGFVWRPTAAVALRAAAGGGFAEAPLNDLVGSSSATPNCGVSFCTESVKNVNLQPERSFSFDVGTDIRLRQDTVLSFDLYRSNLYGQLYSSTSLTGTFGGLPVCTTQYGNLGLSRFEGVLLDLRHDTPRGLYWSLSGGLTRGYLVSVPAGFYNLAGVTCTPATPANCQNTTVIPNINFNGTFAAAIPYAQGLGRFGYRWSPSKYVDLVGTYYGNNNSYGQPAFVELDGHVGYPLSKRSSLLVTFRNITGLYDGVVQTWSPGNFYGVPTVSGPPWGLDKEEYGPRTILLTTNFSL